MQQDEYNVKDKTRPKHNLKDLIRHKQHRTKKTKRCSKVPQDIIRCKKTKTVLQDKNTT